MTVSDEALRAGELAALGRYLNKETVRLILEAAAPHIQTQGQPETRARRRIRKAVESRGYAVKELTWQPIYDAGEMSGLAGGWDLTVDRPYLANTFPGDDLGGLSVEELLASVDYWLPPDEPCTCDREHHAVMRAGRINDPQKTTHDPACKWHIPYRLRWWKRNTPALADPSEKVGSPIVLAEGQ
ncbi:hypothetical protein ASF72_10715 [Arthrobacter sp. Leaf141]|uniref:hypothetical protein n=1 Tax=Arthrobacter sp. Leaf141 TaxID=1736273 RepID=UPI0006FB741F|nr:hypothetical protein [Arthrobacter sp. Leaf141]KQR02497.1 hypothetical protein ASF72_10715 [Arthrobacter sp. Leaf141]